MLIFVAPVHADEGMWQPHQLPELAPQMKALGLEVDPEKLNDLTDHPMNAIVGLGFCSASFVSPEGLVVTNHHCVQRILQHNSTPEQNLIEDGYLADRIDDELPGNPGSRIYVTVEVTDITTNMLDGIFDSWDGLARQRELEKREKALVASCESEDGYRCGVHSFYEGQQFFLIRQLEIRDVRLVYSPPRGIGEYGGDIDNWMWPRHTGDYSFIRGYVAPDGSPADYSEDNVPYQPEHYLTVSTRGLQAGDFTMAVGYPGSTYRHRLASEAGEIGSWYYPTRKALFENMLAIIERETAEREAAAIKYSSLKQGLNNVIKNYGGMIEGFARSGLVDRKAAGEKALQDWLDNNAGDELAVDSLTSLNELIEEYRAGREQRMVYRDFLRSRAQLLSAAAKLYRLSREKQKPDAEREPGFQERDFRRIRESMARLDNNFDEQVDRALLKHHLALYDELPDEQRVAAFDRWFELGGKGLDSRVERKLDAMYRDTTLDDADIRMQLLEASPADFESSDDPFILLAVALYENDIERELETKRYQGRFQLARSRYMNALSTWMKDRGDPLYADANGTLRVTFGQVTGYEPRDAVRYEPFTTVAGVVEKHTGKKPFNTPPELLAAIDQGQFGAYADPSLDSVPVNFLATLDSTGGNSGSAVLDAHGELVGLLFDGNYEAINADWYLDEAISRSICVDIRYVLWIMETVDGAHRLLREMGIGPAALHARRQAVGVN